MLNEMKLRGLKPKDKPYKLADGGNGLYAYVSPKGSISFRYDGRLNDRRITVTLGKYPHIMTLSKARQELLRIKAQLKKGIHPSTKEINLENFSFYADAYLNKQVELSPITLKNKRKKIFKHLTKLDSIPIDKITAQDIYKIIIGVANNGSVSLAHNLASYASAIFNYLFVQGLIPLNVAFGLKAALPKDVYKKNFPAFKTKDELKYLLSELNRQERSVTYFAIHFLLHSALRSRNIRFLEWTEIDSEKHLINISNDKMKTRKGFIMPITDAMLKILTSVRKLTGHRRYVFYSEHSSSGVLSENTLAIYLQRLVGDTPGNKTITAHGIRTVFSTTMNELLSSSRAEALFDENDIEMQLAHQPRGVKGIYDHSHRVEARRHLLERWDSYLGELTS